MNTSQDLQIVETPVFVVDMVRRSWRERLFSLPWHPCEKLYSVNIPSMKKIGNDIYCHPDLLSSALQMLEHLKEAGDECCNCEWTWDSATSNGQCEFCEKRQWLEEDDQI